MRSVKMPSASISSSALITTRPEVISKPEGTSQSFRPTAPCMLQNGPSSNSVGEFGLLPSKKNEKGIRHQEMHPLHGQGTLHSLFHVCQSTSADARGMVRHSRLAWMQRHHYTSNSRTLPEFYSCGSGCECVCCVCKPLTTKSLLMFFLVSF